MTPVQQAVVQHFKTPLEELLSHSNKSQHFVRIRHLAFYLERMDYGRPFQYIGKVYGGRDHSGIIAACNHMNDRVRLSDAWVLEHLGAVRNLAKGFGVQEAALVANAHVDVGKMHCPTCGAPLIAELRRQIAELQEKVSKMEKTSLHVVEEVRDAG